MIYFVFFLYIITLIVNSLALFIIGILTKQYKIKILKFLFHILLITLLSTITFILDFSVHSIFSINLNEMGFNTNCLAIILPIQYLLLYWVIIISLLITEKGIDEFSIPADIKSIFFCTPLITSILIILSGQLKGPRETITAIFIMHYTIVFISLFYQLYIIIYHYKNIEPFKKKLLPLSIIMVFLFIIIVISQFYFPLFWDIFRDITINLPKGIDLIVIHHLILSIIVIKKSTKYLFITKNHVNSTEYYNENIKRYSISKREEEIISLIIEGYSNKAISAELDIALTTVKKHITNMFQKTDVENRIELINLFR